MVTFSVVTKTEKKNQRNIFYLYIEMSQSPFVTQQGSRIIFRTNFTANVIDIHVWVQSCQGCQDCDSSYDWDTRTSQNI